MPQLFLLDNNALYSLSEPEVVWLNLQYCDILSETERE